MLTRIKIDGYKSFRGAEVKLADLSVLYGPNAAGKSNLVECLQLLSRLATARPLKEAFAPPHRGGPIESFTFGEQGIEGALKQERLSFSIEADVRLSDAVIEAVNQSGRQDAVRERSLRYRIEVEMLPESGALRVADEYLAAITDNGEPTGRAPFLSVDGDRLHIRLEDQARSGYYERYPNRSVLAMPHHPSCCPHLIAMRMELESWRFFRFEPREMLATTPVKKAHQIGFMGEHLVTFLNTLKSLDEDQFRAIEDALSAILPDVQGIDVRANDLGEPVLALIENGVPVPAGLLSEGTLRILGLLSAAHAMERSSLICIEDVDSGIHQLKLRSIAEFLKTRASGETQYIVTTHSSYLPELVSDESLFICKKIGGATCINPFMAWCGPSQGSGRSIDRERLDEVALLKVG